MKTAKLIVGIISIILFIIITLQSCVAGIGNSLEGNGEVSGSAGLLLAFCMLIAGIVGISTRKSKGGGITAGIFYAIGGIIAIANVGTYADLKIWAIISFIFAVIFLIGSFYPKKQYSK
ncbi:membrane protein [Bacillus sp. FJAT-27916]|uniref:hypothetical protein n=1 Tax=Bacillus sp. FJAT-27916 TaxID=1679169 RepID=UPI00067094DF|nr:hypothetical protein [Bacillus sp. FJAT-27916]KMY44285.1 membrane protein [Bacillus sp. FJAT-27916]